METKNQNIVIQKIQRRLKFPNSFVVSPVGLAGGLVVFWNAQMQLSIERHNAHFIDLLCTAHPRSSPMRITCIHAPSVYLQRQQLWQELRQISSYNNLPWICIGDFNEIMYHWEKVGKKFADSYRMQSFRSFIDSCSLMDVHSKGCAFTWVNNRAGDNEVKERLDRLLCTIEWRISYPAAEVFALPAIASDHSPLLLLTDGPKQKRYKSFIFEAFWVQHQQSRQVIAEAWDSSHLQFASLDRKLQSLSTVLARWSKSTFSHGRDRINLLQQELQCIMNRSNINYGQKTEGRNTISMAARRAILGDEIAH